jgi:hypothetical protein
MMIILKNEQQYQSKSIPSSVVEPTILSSKIEKNIIEVKKKPFVDTSTSVIEAQS